MDIEEKRYELLINKALLKATDSFYTHLKKNGYEDCIALDITAFVISSDYEYILKKFNHSNIGSFLKPKEIL